MQGVRALYRPRIYHFEAPLEVPPLPSRGSDRSISLDRSYEPLEPSRSRATDPPFPISSTSQQRSSETAPPLAPAVLTEVALSVT